MRAVSRAFTRSSHPRGICIGIIPCASRSDRATPKSGYPNEFVELAIYTHLPDSGDQGTDDLSRNHINVLSCAAIVALPGEAGTVSEVSLAVRYGKPVVAYSPSSAFAEKVPASVSRVVRIDDVSAFLRVHLNI
jgi:predicted Rossmann-fold nucleotide-binding protein